MSGQWVVYGAGGIYGPFDSDNVASEWAHEHMGSSGSVRPLRAPGVRMRGDTRDALEASIEKWREIAATGDVEGRLGMENCPLCQLHWGARECNATCPVKGRTGMDHCNGTPYDWFEGGDASDDGEEIKEHACEQLAFLSSLREP